MGLAAAHGHRRLVTGELRNCTTSPGDRGRSVSSGNVPPAVEISVVRSLRVLRAIKRSGDSEILTTLLAPAQ